jgi:hypothetical protein
MRARTFSLVPAPSMVTVSSLSIFTFLHRPRSLVPTSFQLDAQVLADGLAARQDGDVLVRGLVAVATGRALAGAVGGAGFGKLSLARLGGRGGSPRRDARHPRP